jgi:hypothetical protein
MDTNPTTSDLTDTSKTRSLCEAVWNCKGISSKEKDILTGLILEAMNASFALGYAACKRNHYIPDIGA